LIDHHHNIHAHVDYAEDKVPVSAPEGLTVRIAMRQRSDSDPRLPMVMLQDWTGLLDAANAKTSLKVLHDFASSQSGNSQINNIGWARFRDDSSPDKDKIYTRAQAACAGT
jgi:hypothetical protein